MRLSLSSPWRALLSGSIHSLLVATAMLGLAASGLPAAATAVEHPMEYTDAFAQRYVRGPAGDWLLQVEDGAPLAVDPTTVTVRFRDDATDAARAAVLGALHLTEIRANRLGFVDLRVPAGADPVAVVQALSASGVTESADLNTIGRYLLLPNDPNFGQQWHLNQGNDADIDAPEAWDLETGDPGVVVAVLDSGTDFTHDDLGMGSDAYQNVWTNPGEDAWTNSENPATGNGADDDLNGLVDDWKGWDFLNANNDSRGPFDHGTMVGGIVAAKTGNGYRVAGVAGGLGNAGASVMICGVGDFSPSTNILDDAILYATDMGADIITMSLTVGQTAAIDAALQAAWDAGLFIDCASGNGGAGSPVSYPANNVNVVAVGSTNESDLISNFSSRGVDQEVAAPGSNITSLTFGDGTTTGSGTSFAAPIVAGTAALMKSINPNMSNAEIRTVLRNTAEKVGPYNYNWNVSMPGHSQELGYGRINAHLAVMEAGATAGLVLAPGAPATVASSLGQNVPNPFNPSTTIGFRIVAPGRATVKLYAPDGRLVATLADRIFDSGEHAVAWNGRDAAGRRVASGVYVYELNTNGVREARKLLLSK